MYELRYYRIASGWMNAMHERMESVLLPMFRETGVPHPAGAWEASAGPSLPCFIWMLKWPDFETRQKAWAAVAPVWQKRRAETAKTEFVTSIDICLLAAWPEIVPPMGSLMGPSLDELWVHRIAVTHGPAARASFLASDCSALADADATLKLGFDLVSGQALPSFGALMSWPNAEARQAGMERYERSEGVADRRRQERSSMGVPIFNATDRYLLTPLAYMHRV